MKYGVDNSALLEVDDPEVLLRIYLERTLDKIVQDSRADGNINVTVPPAVLVQQLSRENEVLKAQLKALEEVDDVEFNKLYDRIDALEASNNSLEAAHAKLQQEARDLQARKESHAQAQPSTAVGAGALVLAQDAGSSPADESNDKLLQEVHRLVEAATGSRAQDQLETFAQDTSAKLRAMEVQMQAMAAELSKGQLGFQSLQNRQLDVLEKLVKQRVEEAKLVKERVEEVSTAEDGELVYDAAPAHQANVAYQSTTAEQDAAQQPAQQRFVLSFHPDGHAIHTIMPGMWDCDMCQVQCRNQPALVTHMASNEHKKFVQDVNKYYSEESTANPFASYVIEPPLPDDTLRCQLCDLQLMLKSMLTHQLGKRHANTLASASKVKAREDRASKRKRQDK